MSCRVSDILMAYLDRRSGQSFDTRTIKWYKILRQQRQQRVMTSRKLPHRKQNLPCIQHAYNFKTSTDTHNSTTHNTSHFWLEDPPSRRMLCVSLDNEWTLHLFLITPYSWPRRTGTEPIPSNRTDPEQNPNTEGTDVAVLTTRHTDVRQILHPANKVYSTR